MKRAIIFTVVLMSAIAAKAQLPYYLGGGPSMYSAPLPQTDTGAIHKKWFLTKYAGISTGFVAFKGGSGSYLSAPLVYQLNRQLTNNVIAFGGVSATPYMFSMNSSMYQPATGKNYGMMRNRNFGLNPSAQIGVMYMSNDRTFSISGSISVSSSTYSPLYGPVNSFVQ